MGLTRKEVHSNTVNSITEQLKAIAHPVRFSVVLTLLENETVTVGELTETMSLAQSTISEHLTVLKFHNFIKGTPIGPAVHYKLNLETWSEFKVVLRRIAEEL